MSLTQSRLKEVLRYDEVTGEFFWIVRASPKTRIGSKAGSKCNDYLSVRFEGKNYYCHRLAWLYMTGVMPDEVEHRNGIGTDNSWLNLRLATRSQNNSNRGKGRNNKSGIKGVHWSNTFKVWIGVIRHEGKSHYVGRFNSLTDAAEAMSKARAIIHGDFARD